VTATGTRERTTDWFDLTARGTTPAREIQAGVTTFAAMAYILAVNPGVLADAGMPRPALVTVTALTGSADPIVVSAVSLAGGTDDRGSIVEATWTAADFGSRRKPRNISLTRASTSHPISLDETITTPLDLLRARDLGAGEIVNIKIGRVGGLTRARRLRDLALECGMGVLVEDTGGTILADTAAAQLASTVPARSLIGTWSCQELITVDPAPGQGARVIDGMMRAPDAPGLGVEIDPEALGRPAARYALSTTTQTR